MKWRSFVTVLLAFAVVMLVIAGSGLAWVLAQSPLNLRDGGVSRNPEAAMFVSRQSPVMASLLVNPDRLESLLQIETPLRDRAQTRQELRDLKAGLLAPTGLDYRRDIQPWLGEEITIALTSLDYDRNPENGQQPGYLLVATAKDGEYAREFLQILYAKSAIAGQSDLVFEQYKGVNLVYPRLRATGATPFASAVVGDRFVLFANHPKVLRAAINNVQVPQLNLANSAAYRTALETTALPHVGLAYVNLLAIAKAFDTDPTQPAPSLTFSFALSETGLVANTAVTGLLPTVRSQPQLTAPVGAMRYLPPRTSFTAAGVNLQQWWQQVDAGFGENSPVSGLITTLLAQLQAPLGLDLPQEIFSWVEGEYAISLLPNRDWVFAAERNDQTAAAIAHLDELAKAQGLTTGTVAIADIPVTVWTELVALGGRVSAEIKGVHATVGEYELLANSLDAVTNMVQPQRTSLLENPEFQDAIAPLPSPNDGYVFIDWPRIQPVLERQFPLLKVADVAAKPLLEHLRTVALTSNGTKNGISRATLSLEVSLF